MTFPRVVTVSVVLAACQVNNVRDTGGGAVSPSSTVTGVTLDSGTNGNPIFLRSHLDRRNLLLCKRKTALQGGFQKFKHLQVIEPR
ncbi:colicin release lysis protein [Klebsiella pneumoniae]|uniref:Lysis protein for colicin n=1 Tax=Klebsiella pneumoniae TaxID=573 RepID=A0A939SV16_KLEPN|nr:colicin release lysis protein [Klebsiella pneumoniae]